MLLVLNGFRRTLDDLQAIAELSVAELTANHGALAAVVVNRADPQSLGQVAEALAVVGVPAYALPEESVLSQPTPPTCWRRSRAGW